MIMINLDQIERAQQMISPHVQFTPIVHSPSLSDRNNSPVFLKFEHLQTTGSFKLLGAINAVLLLNEQQKRQGVVGVSAGNHGKGLAYAAKQAGVSCIVCMSNMIPQN